MKTLASCWKLLLLGLVLLGLASCRKSAPNTSTEPSATASATASAIVSSAPAASSSTAPQRSPAKGLWWKVTSKQATLYFLGSIHVAPPDLYPLDPRIERAFASADTLVLELDLSKVSPLKVALKVAHLARYPADDSLDKHVDAKTWELVEKHAPGGLLSSSALKRYRPGFVATAILASKLEELGYDQQHGLDRHFADLAEKNKPVIGLETVEEQVAVFTSMPEKLELLMLEQTLAELDHIGPQMRRVLEGWRRGDEKPIANDLLASLHEPEYRPLLDALLLERNRRWVKTFIELLDTDKTYFVVVGAGHLVGKDSVIDLLQRHKYTVAKQ